MSAAPTVFISYSHDSNEHAARVLALADSLCLDGIDVILDQYVHPAPEEGWPLWMERSLKARFVLMICTETYLRRVMAEEEAGKGTGVAWEGKLIYNRICYGQPAGTTFIPILLPGSTPEQIPGPVRGYSHYVLAAFDLRDPQYKALYGHLTDQQITPKPDLPPIKILPPIVRTRPSAGPFPPEDDAAPEVSPVEARRNPEIEGPAGMFVGREATKATLANTTARLEAALSDLEKGRPHEAIQVAGQVLISDPDSMEAHYVMALAHVVLGDLRAAGEAFETALRLNPDHRPSLLGASIVSLELSGPLKETADRVRVETWLRHLMELEPPHQHAHQAARRLFAELPDYTPTLLESDPPRDRKRARWALFRRIYDTHSSGGMRIRSWLEALPPWSIIDGLGLPVEVSCLAFAAIPYTLVLACNIQAWSPLFFLKFGVIALIIFLGYWHAFLFSKMLNNSMGRLRIKLRRPSDAFEEWCLEKIASFWGSVNLPYPLRSSQQIRKLTPIDRPFLLALARRKAAFFEALARLRRDHQIVSASVFLFLLVTPINIWCAADRFSADAAGLSRHLMYVLEVYSAVWSFPLVCTLLILAPGIIEKFLDEEIGPYPSDSVSPLGYLYLRLGLLATYTYGITLAQHYLWRTHLTAPNAAIAMNVICFAFTLVALVAPHVCITLSIWKVKAGRLAEYSLPLQDSVARREQEANRQYLQEKHSIWWFDNRSLLGFVLLALTSLLLPSVYLYLVWKGIWLF